MEATAAVGGAGRLVIGKGAYDGRKNDYEKCLRFLGMSDPYIYNGNKDSYGKRFVTYEAADGKPGLGGRSGRSCGEIVVGRVTIDAIPGAAATGGSQGSFGPTAKVKDESFSYAHYNSVAFGHAAVVIGIVGCFIPPVGYVGAFLSVIQTFLDMGGISDWKDLRKIGWLTGGGGGGGGGAGALEWFDSPAKFLSYDLYGAGGLGGQKLKGVPSGGVRVVGSAA